MDITTVKELLGHKDIKMTLRYAHLAPSHKVKTVDILDNTLNGGMVKKEICYSRDLRVEMEWHNLLKFKVELNGIEPSTS